MATATSLYVLYEGDVVPVPHAGPLLADVVCDAVELFERRRGIVIRGGLNVFAIAAEERAKMFADPAYAPVKAALDPALPLETAAFAGGAQLVMLERKPGSQGASAAASGSDGE